MGGLRMKKKMKITRSILEVLWAHRHPVTIITKNALILRDLDLLKSMGTHHLIKVAISVTSLSTALKKILEPRTTAPIGRIRAIRILRENNIPVRVMVAPVIPMITDMEMEKILQAASEAGAAYASYVLIRLPYEVKDLFKEWLAKHFPDRAAHVMSLIRQMHGGKEYDAQFGVRFKGQGVFAKLLTSRFHLACQRYQLNVVPSPPLTTHLFKTK